MIDTNDIILLFQKELVTKLWDKQLNFPHAATLLNIEGMFRDIESSLEETLGENVDDFR